MKKFTKTFIITVSVIALLSVLLMTLSYNMEISSAQGAFASVFMPMQKAAATVVSTVKKTTENVAHSSENAKENEKLKMEIAHLSDELRMVDGYKNENEKLRAMLKLRDIYETQSSVAANVIGTDAGDLTYTVTIDKGTKDGVRINSVAVVPEGLVGVVCEAGKNYAKIKTVLDSSSSVSAICQRSGDIGALEGNAALAKDGKCLLNYIDKDAKIVIGDSIETSGTGGILPRGILIGKITQIKADERNLTLCATVKSDVKIRNLTTVLIYR